MKIYIMTDIEGISGISSSSYVSASKNRPDLIAEGRVLMAGDINACVEGCFQGGATEVIVKDCHGGGFNVTRSMIDPRADLIDGDTPGERFADIEGSAGLILLGYHPGFIQLIYRLGDSPTNAFTPLSPYIWVTLGVAQAKYDKDAKIGTLAAGLFPIGIALQIAWIIMLGLWMLADLPIGPGVGIEVPAELAALVIQ